MITIERATEDDLADILAIDAAQMGTSRSEYLEKAVRQRECYIARVGWDALGFATLAKSFFDHYMIDLLVVRPEQRRKGTATALIRHLEKIIPEEKLFTSTNQSNAPMQAVLEKLGYVKSGWIDNLDEGDPEIIYFKHLSG